MKEKANAVALKIDHRAWINPGFVAWFSMIELKKITDDNFDACIQLNVKEEQKGFVATNVKSLAQAYVRMTDGGYVKTHAIYNDDTMVGFIMYGYDTDFEFQTLSSTAYFIWRFMIDEKHQGKGYGRKAMEKVIAEIRTMPFGKSECVWLSYEPENLDAKKLYESLGFNETGEMNEDEVLTVLKI